MILYKYRSLKELKWVLEILIEERLYASKPTELNDPQESKFIYNDANAPTVQDMTEKFNHAYICALSKSKDNGMLWTQYADTHNGCCIEVEVEDNDGWKGYDVSYFFNQKRINKDKTVGDLLKIKCESWAKENEYRFIKLSEERPYLKAKVLCVYLGVSVSKDGVKFYKDIFKKLAPTVEVVQMNEKDIK